MFLTGFVRFTIIVKVHVLWWICIYLCWARESMWVVADVKLDLMYNGNLCVCLFVLLFSPCYDHILPQHHTSGTGSHDWDELHCSRWKAHQGSLGEGISYHQPRHEPLCGYSEGSGRWGHIHPAGERERNHTPHFQETYSGLHWTCCQWATSFPVKNHPALSFGLIFNIKLALAIQ